MPATLGSREREGETIGFLGVSPGFAKVERSLPAAFVLRAEVDEQCPAGQGVVCPLRLEPRCDPPSCLGEGVLDTPWADVATALNSLAEALATSEERQRRFCRALNEMMESVSPSFLFVRALQTGWYPPWKRFSERARLATELLLEQVGGADADPGPRQIDNAAWVGWRLAELLPMSDQQRQVLLQEDDPHARLQQLLSLVSEEAL